MRDFAENIVRFILPVLLLMLAPAASSQIVITPDRPKYNSDSLRAEFDKGPYFGLYKDNYFVFGPSLKDPNKTNTNVKFQVSIQQKLTRSVLPFGSYLYLYYTQKVFWNVLEKSLPMTDLNFNPGIGLAKPLFSGNRYIGKISLQLEHESNGRDSVQSRSWNRITFGTNIIIDPNLMIHGKIWIPIIDGENNRDILDYCGIYQVGLQVMTEDRRWKFGVTLVKRRGWKPDYNVIGDLSFRFWRNADWNLFMQYYNGYGEGLLDYNRYSNHLRVGIVIRPPLFSDY